ncbi:hypothetical protein, partial [Burkholderia multivorans]|uniref:hypothetical protein n=3 Tax=Burkholderia multivorans TaxID=87883 RepID=UPI001C24B00C
SRSSGASTVRALARRRTPRAMRVRACRRASGEARVGATRSRRRSGNGDTVTSDIERRSCVQPVRTDVRAGLMARDRSKCRACPAPIHAASTMRSRSGAHFLQGRLHRPRGVARAAGTRDARKSRLVSTGGIR